MADAVNSSMHVDAERVVSIINDVENVISAIDASSKLYLHHSDHPNYSLAGKALDGDNYGHWRRAVEVSLIAKDKLGFVTGKCDCPDSSSPLRSAWDRCSNMVISWILHSVNNDIAESVVYCVTAREIWSELEQRFRKPNGARIFQLQRDLCQISQGILSISGYYTKIKKLWDELGVMIQIPSCACGSGSSFLKILHDQRLIQFLMGLNDSYNAVRGNVLMMNPLPATAQAYQLLLQEEKQRDVYTPSPINGDSVAFASQQQKPMFYHGHSGARNEGASNFMDFLMEMVLERGRSFLVRLR